MLVHKLIYEYNFYIKVLNTKLLKSGYFVISFKVCNKVLDQKVQIKTKKLKRPCDHYNHMAFANGDTKKLINELKLVFHGVENLTASSVEDQLPLLVKVHSEAIALGQSEGSRFNPAMG